MKQETATKLIDLNRQFNQTFAGPFSATRQRLQPGVRRVAGDLLHMPVLLDLGCGNGELALHLIQMGFRGYYLGVDFSPGLITAARDKLSGRSNVVFELVDLTSPDWDDNVQYLLEKHNVDQPGAVLAFAVLHHIPGETLRLTLLNKVKRLIRPGGMFLHSVWQFQNSPRLSKRVQPWSLASLAEAEVDPGDYLLDWRHAGTGLRYVHQFNEPELSKLADQAGFSINNTFYSDGDGGRLGLYQLWLSE